MGGTICGFSMPAPFGRRSALTLAFYSDRLQGQWGISEVRDCILAAQHLSTSLNIIDPSRIFIRGGSAGGYTVLAAISSTPPDTPSEFKWTGAASLYGVSDLRRLAEDTHKFESKYLDGLLGGSYEEIPEVYKERSPISHVDKIDTPLLVSCTLRTSPPPKALDMEIYHGMYRSFRGQKTRLSHHPKQSLLCTHWKREAKRSNTYFSKARDTDGGKLRISRRGSRQS